MQNEYKMIHLMSPAKIEAIPILKAGCAVLIDVGKLMVNHRVLDKLIKAKPTVICFFGEKSELWHDAFDNLLVQQDKHLETITTWHSDEPEREVLWEFLNVHVPLNAEQNDVYIIGLDSKKLISLAQNVNLN